MRRDPKLTRCHLILGVLLLSISPTPGVVISRCRVFYSLGLPSHRLRGLCLRAPAAGPQELYNTRAGVVL